MRPEHNQPAKPEPPALIDLKDVAPALKALSQSVDQFPKNFAAEVDLAMNAMSAGLVLGLFLGAVMTWIVVSAFRSAK